MTSLMSLVDIDAATVPQGTQVSDDSKLILQAIHDLSGRLSVIERSNGNRTSKAGGAVRRTDLDDIPPWEDGFDEQVLHDSIGKVMHPVFEDT